MNMLGKPGLFEMRDSVYLIHNTLQDYQIICSFSTTSGTNAAIATA